MKDMKSMKLNKFSKLSEQVIGAAIEVHKTLGLDLLESAFKQYLAYLLNYMKLAKVKYGLKSFVL